MRQDRAVVREPDPAAPVNLERDARVAPLPLHGDVPPVAHHPRREHQRRQRQRCEGDEVEQGRAYHGDVPDGSAAGIVPASATNTIAGVAKKPPPVGSINVLFLGNSFTARNDLPGLIASLARAAGGGFDHRLISVGGASLRTHWNTGEAADAIRTGGYDYVVLQEQSTLPIKNPVRMRENVRLFDEVIRDGGAKTALYMTWARRHAPQTQRAITDAYASAARDTGATVGVVWQRFLASHDRPVLHDRDGSHPAVAGSYLAACVFFAALFSRSPVGVGGSVAGLDPSDIELLQEAASSAVR